MNLLWTRENLVSYDWIKITLISRSVDDGNVGSVKLWRRVSIKPVIEEIKAFLGNRDERWMVNAQDYSSRVQFAVESDVTAMMIRMLFDGEMIIEPLKLRPDQIRFKKKLGLKPD